ncbi:type I restriction enzyme S subunit [Microbacterium sp. SORGH_AS 505]|uniref:restriction endonuclease subunit S n=1 Tax=Microbacterium sp. SORGH_AS_0505 TaxID=3041770 RepID=UPI00278629D1|nr:restriction endonuclease subunit S [Microbacterium sp. SORGH_AS_0505]MDQ1125038.1 type I restriction enzyme S subunit [Microbacterium sp. SORGH_AS_0505]
MTTGLRLKHVAKVDAGQSPSSSDVVPFDGEGMPFLQGNAEFGGQYPTAVHRCDSAPRIADAGALLVSVRAPVGAVNIANQRYGIGRGLAAVRPRAIHARYAYWLLLSSAGWLNSIATGSTFTAISGGDLGNVSVLVTNEREQRAIADYLDRETAQIDAFIAKNEELITLLTERRASVIGSAVTRGLDERVELSTEGPEWIGAVPAPWKVLPIKSAYSVVVGKMLNEAKSEGDPVPYVRAANIQPDGLDLSDVKEMKATPADRRTLALRSGDVVFVEGGGGYGRSDYLAQDLPGWIFQNHVIRLRPRPGHDGRFLNYWLQHVKRLGHYEALSAFATIPNVSGDKLGRIEMPVPSLSQQREIVKHIEEATSRIDAAVGVAQRNVELARERRAALISAAVTGRIDVGVAV